MKSIAADTVKTVGVNWTRCQALVSVPPMCASSLSLPACLPGILYLNRLQWGNALYIARLCLDLSIANLLKSLCAV